MNTKDISEVMALHDKAAIAIKRAAIQSDVDAFLEAGNARAALESKVRELEKDAARYRWLRSPYTDPIDPLRIPVHPLPGADLYGDDLDAAIDAALAAQKPEASNGR